MSRVALRLASTAAAVAAVGILAAPASAGVCAIGEKITGRTSDGWICTNIKTGAERIVPFNV